MNLFRKTFGFLVVLSLLLGLFSMPAFTYADDEPCSADNTGACECKEGGNTPCCDSGVYYDQVTKGISGAGEHDNSYLVTEIHEPLSSLEEQISNGSITISEVKLKYQCRTYITTEWVVDPEQTSCTGSDCVETNTGVTLKKVYHENEVTSYMYLDYDAECPADASCSYVQFIVSTSGTGLLKTYIAIIYRWAAGLVGIIAILVIVISGIQISIDQGGGENVTAAKNRIMQSIAGLVILFLSGLILYTINPTFFTK